MIADMEEARKLSVEELHQEMKAQKVPSREHIAFKCVVCRTVQSLRSFERAGVLGEEAEKYLGFSCIGRFTNAGPWGRRKKRREVPGCDWTLGGLFTIHRVVVVTPDGKEHPSFELASPEEAQALAARDGEIRSEEHKE
jgi:hypothetical protein